MKTTIYKSENAVNTSDVISAASRMLALFIAFAGIVILVSFTAKGQTLSVSITPSTSMCSGSYVGIVVTASSSCTSTSYNYYWNSSAGSLSGGSSITVSPTSTTTYYVTVTDACSITNSASTTVNVIQSPSAATINGSGSLCANQSGSYSISSVGADSYGWSSSGGVSISGGTGNFTNAWGNSSGSIAGYGVKNGCYSSPSILPITINSNPTVTVSPASTTICTGSSVTLNAISGASSYSWSPSTGLSSATGASVNAYPSVSTNYTVNVTDANGCTASATAAVTVNSQPSPISSISGSTSVNSYTSATYSINGGSGATSYSWDVPSGASVSGTGTSVLISFGNNSGYVSASATNSCGTVNNDIYVTVSTPCPTVSAAGSISGLINVGIGDEQIKYSILPVFGATSYTWSANTSYISVYSNQGNTALINFSPSLAAGTYQISVTPTNYCTSGSSSSISVTVNSSWVAVSQSLYGGSADGFDTKMRGIPINTSIYLEAGTYLTRGAYDVAVDNNSTPGSYGFKIKSGWKIFGASLATCTLKLVDVNITVNEQGWPNHPSCIWVNGVCNPNPNGTLFNKLQPGYFNGINRVLANAQNDVAVNNVTIKDLTINCNYNSIANTPMNSSNVSNLNSGLGLSGTNAASSTTLNGPNLTLEGINLFGGDNLLISHVKVIHSAGQRVMADNAAWEITWREENWVIWIGNVNKDAAYATNCLIEYCEVSEYNNPDNIHSAPNPSNLNSAGNITEECSAISLVGVNGSATGASGIAKGIITNCTVTLTFSNTNNVGDFAFNVARTTGVQVIHNIASNLSRGVQTDAPPIDGLQIKDNFFYNCLHGIWLSASTNTAITAKGVADGNTITLIPNPPTGTGTGALYSAGAATGIKIIPIPKVGIPVPQYAAGLSGAANWLIKNNTISGMPTGGTPSCTPPYYVNWGIERGYYNACQDASPTFYYSTQNNWADVKIEGNNTNDLWNNIGNTTNKVANNNFSPGNRTDVAGTTQCNNAIGFPPSPAPDAPTTNDASGITGTSFSANWIAATGATTYYFDISANSSFSSFVTGYNNLNVGNVVTYNVTGLSSSTAYYYRVRAANACGTSGNSSTITVSTTAVSCTSATSIFNYTGSLQSWTVPSDVTSITVDVSGAQGGNSPYATGGKGGRVQGVITVTPGEVLNIYVGGAGTTCNGGGYNGGGNTPCMYSQQRRGGGASDIRRAPYALSNRLVVGAGGGGAGYNYGSSCDNGGDGGGLTGVSYPVCSGTAATGGTQSGGGAGGTYSGWSNGVPGTLGIGGDVSGTGGGGGGGGYYGGGGGSWGGGAGGSSLTPAGGSTTSGYKTSDGQVTITTNCGTTTTTAPPVVPSNSITTTFAGGNGHNGNMFDVTALNSVTITSMDAHPQGNADYAIYYKVGTWVGSENNSSQWTLVGSALNVVAQPFGTATPIPITLNITIPAGQTDAFYVTTTNGVTQNYTDGTSVGAIYASDANIQIREGCGIAYSFSSIFTPRIWNGIIHYSGGTAKWTGSGPLVSPAVMNQEGYQDMIMQDREKILTIYPNPVKDRFTIEIPGILLDNTSITVYNLLGEVIAQVSESEVRQVNSIDLSGNSSGLYYVRITNNGRELANEKLILIKEK